MQRENILAVSIGGALFLIYLLYWLLRMGSLGILADAFFVVGFVGFGYLIWFYVKDRYSLKKLAISIVGGIVLCGVLTLAILIAVAGASTMTVEVSTYTISVQGLAKAQGGLITTIIVPIPMVNERLVFSDEELQNQMFGRWTSTLVMPDEGKMLAFQTQDRNLTDIHAIFSKGDIRDVRHDIQSVCFSPVVDVVPAGESMGTCGSGILAEQSTMVFVDDTIRSIDEADHTLTFDLDFTTGGGAAFGRQQATYRARVSEVIAGGTTGPIPVRAQTCRD